MTLVAVRRALVRAAVGSLLAVPAGLVWGSFAVFLVASFAVATIPLSLAEIAAAKRERVGWGWHVVVFLGALPLVVGGALEAAYAEGIYRTHSIPGALEHVERFVSDALRPDLDIGYLSTAITVTIMAGVAVSFWAPFGAARMEHASKLEGAAAHFVTALFAAIAGAFAMGVLLGIATSVVFRESLAVMPYALVFIAIGAGPGTIALPIVYSIADNVDRALWPAASERASAS